VAEVRDNTPAAEAGLVPGMVIDQVGDRKIMSVLEFRAAVALMDGPVMVHVLGQGVKVIPATTSAKPEAKPDATPSTPPAPDRPARRNRGPAPTPAPKAAPDKAAPDKVAPVPEKSAKTPADVQVDIAKTQMAMISNALGLYTANIGHDPTEEEGGLKALVTRPAFSDEKMAANWRGPYIREGGLLDPWSNPWHYELVPQGKSDLTGPSYKLWSAGPDGKDGTADDIHN
jgi:general secretion pathway protein G